jgi:adenosine deaminase
MMGPTAELHVHIEGTLEPDLLVRLARRNGIDLPTYDVDELRATYAFTRLQDFLDVYEANTAVLRTDEDFAELGDMYFRRAAAAGVVRAEVFFDPQAHVRRGVPIEAVIEGLGAAVDAARSRGMSADLILCFLRDLGPEAAMEVFEAALPLRDRFIGVGLDSTEVGYPPSLFRDVYARAAAEGLHRVAHAGEEGGPDYVWEALDVLGVERIDHGNRALEDPALVARLRDEGVALTVCPLSNLALRTAPPELSAHPLPVMLEEGLLVSIHSDDPAYFGGYVDDNLRQVRDSLQLDDETMRRLAENSFVSSFAPRAQVDGWIAQVRTAAVG